MMHDTLMMHGTTRWQLSENSALIGVYAWLRLLIAVLLLLFSFYPGAPDLGSDFPKLFERVAWSYCAIALVAGFYLQSQRGNVSIVMIVVSFMIDITALVLMAHASGGISSGLPTLLVVLSSIAAILLGPRLAVFIAALASLAILLEMVYRSLYVEFFSGGFLLAGLYGMACFAACLLILHIASRLRVSQQLAISRAEDVAKLQHLNQLVVERLRTGLMVLDWHGQILMANRAAKELIFTSQDNESIRGGLAVLPPAIKILFDLWLKDSRVQPMPLRLRSNVHKLQISFTPLSDQQQGDVLVFVEDQTELSQRAQQMKLASLGRFSASIAHEIRNPLGAISHAAQLLSESEALDDQDRQLSDIIQNHCLRMNRIVENVLQLSRRHQANQSTFVVAAWIEKFLLEFRQSKSEKLDIRISIAPTMVVKFDPDHLSQIMNNLLDNALRYSYLKTGSWQADVVAYQNPENGLPCVDVIDYGDGVMDEDSDKIFEPFFTTENTGNGLGLYLCRQLCEANQASINWLRTSHGESCFRILFAHPDRRGWVSTNA
jgi:two-component system sensor histidine kinase PilS (NtrC family)